MKPIRRLFSMIFKRDTYRFFSLGRYGTSYDQDVGDPMGSSIVAACVGWFAKNFPEAPPALWKRIATSNQKEQVFDHAMLELLQRPNGHYTGPMLWMATTTDWNVNGDAYWIVVPNRAGTPVELWWTPSWMMTPKGRDDDQSSFISYYEYLVDGEPTRLDPRYVVHFRYGLDPENPRRGCSPLKSVLREIFTDNEAADYTAAILHNMGVPGLMVSPEKGVTIADADAMETKADLKTRFTGDKRGEPLVFTGPTKIEQFGFSPEQLLLRELRRIPEERVSAATGVPAIVAGLGAGLERSTFTNMAEAREAAYESGLIPAQRILGEDVRFQLLPLFGENPFKWRFGFDLSEVRVLQEDLTRQALRYGQLVRDGIAMVSEGRRGMGFEVDDARDNIFLRPANVTQVDGSSGAVTPLAPAKAASTNGHATVAEIGDEVEQRLTRRELIASP